MPPRRALVGLVIFVFVVVGAGCAITRAGKCVDYKPLAACPLGTYFECQHTSDGCEQCSCVSERRDGRAPLPGD